MFTYYSFAYTLSVENIGNVKMKARNQWVYVSDIWMYTVGHYEEFDIILACFLVNILSDVLLETIGHGIRNVGRVRLSDGVSQAL